MDTKQTIIDILTQRRDEQQRDYDLYLQVEQALEAFEGKTITRRLATAVKKALPDHVVHYDADYGMYHLRIWKDNYENRCSFLLGYHSNPVFRMGEAETDHSGFRYYSGSNGFHEKKRLDKNNALLSNTAELDRIADTVCALKTAQADFEALYPELDVYFAIAKKLELKY
jgi:hypothetical protein